MNSCFVDKILDLIRRKKSELAVSYHVDELKIVYIGGNHFIVVKDGKEIRI